VLPLLLELERGGVEVEAQVVVVPGVNDGRVLEDTMEDLYRTGNVTALGMVPVGLTDWREGLPDLRRPDAAESAAVLSLCDSYRRRALDERGRGWIYPADEFLLMTGRKIPSLDWYDDRTLESNGIGLLSRTLHENRGLERSGGGTVCTGDLAWETVSSLLEGSAYEVIRVENRLFGDMVGVAGLLSGGDIVRRLADSPGPGMPVYLPRVMFNHDMCTLDDMTPEDIGRETGMQIEVAGRLSELP
jgi:NifB/MoaA-like Fe-S oxidoreductase